MTIPPPIDGNNVPGDPISRAAQEGLLAVAAIMDPSNARGMPPAASAPPPGKRSAEPSEGVPGDDQAQAKRPRLVHAEDNDPSPPPVSYDSGDTVPTSGSASEAASEGGGAVTTESTEAPAHTEAKKAELPTEGSGAEDEGEESQRFMEYECGYCGQCKVSTSSGADGRVRIRCECGGKHRDKQARMHAKWIARPGKGGTQQELKGRMRAQWRQVRREPTEAEAMLLQAYALSPAMQHLLPAICAGLPMVSGGPGMPPGPNMGLSPALLPSLAMLAQLQTPMAGGAPLVPPQSMPFIPWNPTEAPQRPRIP